MSEPANSRLSERVWAEASISISDDKSVDDVATAIKADAGDGDGA